MLDEVKNPWKDADQVMQNLLPSDSRFRKDLSFLKQKDYENALKEKKVLEEQERNDLRIRGNFQK